MTWAESHGGALRERGRCGDTLEEPCWELWRREGLHHAVVILCRDSFHVPGVLAVSVLDAPGEGTQVSLPWAGPSSSLGRAGWWLQEKRILLHITPRSPLWAGRCLVCVLVAPGTKLWCGLGAAGRVLLLIQQCL